MMKPITIHRIKRNQVSQGKNIICKRHIAAPSIGTRGTNGVLNGLFTSGDIFLRTIIETQTITKAIRVPIYTNSPRILIGNTPAIIAEAIPVTNVDL